MDYVKIIEDLKDGWIVAEPELRLAAAASIRELLEKNMKLTSELTLARKCLEGNEAAFNRLKQRLSEEHALVRSFAEAYALLQEVRG